MSKTEAEWLGGAQTADYLGVTSMTIWRWERRKPSDNTEPAGARLRAPQAMPPRSPTGI
jgi:hypothetical protein